ncbi:MAG: LPXTG cell wall anchor domain-containing protein [Coriobacteriales bacterium]|nr:LPXTG cell wall anchor domain-containing protein [Coriobacteriales bacterium]
MPATGDSDATLWLVAAAIAAAGAALLAARPRVKPGVTQ